MLIILIKTIPSLCIEADNDWLSKEGWSQVRKINLFRRYLLHVLDIIHKMHFKIWKLDLRSSYKLSSFLHRVVG